MENVDMIMYTYCPGQVLNPRAASVIPPSSSGDSSFSRTEYTWLLRSGAHTATASARTPFVTREVLCAWLYLQSSERSINRRHVYTKQRAEEHVQQDPHTLWHVRHQPARPVCPVLQRSCDVTAGILSDIQALPASEPHRVL